jgi:hypothetical protein
MFDEQRRVLSLALDGLSQLSATFSIRIPFADMTLPVKIEIVDDPNSISGFSQFWCPESQFSHKFICFKAQASVDEENTLLDFGGKPFTLSQKEGIGRDLACLAFADNFSVGVCHVLTAATIALPGGIKTVSPKVIINGIGDRDVPTLDSHLADAVEMAREEGWPPVRDISVPMSWRWFSRLPGLEAGMVSGPVGRAVTALTHILYPEAPFGDMSTGLVWALLGLEAIYGRGSTGVGEQLREKSELLLGKCSSQKKRLSAAYNFRSRFIHGDLDIPFKYTEEVDHDEILKFGNETWEATLFTQALLVSTIQELVLRDSHSISFPYTISSNSIA